MYPDDKNDGEGGRKDGIVWYWKNKKEVSLVVAGDGNDAGVQVGVQVGVHWHRSTFNCGSSNLFGTSSEKKQKKKERHPGWQKSALRIPSSVPDEVSRHCSLWLRWRVRT